MLNELNSQINVHKCLYTLIDTKYPLTESQKILLMIFCLLLCAVAGYLVGSINPAVIISKAVYKDDVRKHGSGNAGMTNVLRTYGRGPALATLALDMLKCAIAVAAGWLLWIDGEYIAGVFCLLGHIFPCWHKFKGGKGVAVTAMIILLTKPVVFVAVLIIFAVVLFSTKYMSLASIMGALMYPLVLKWWNSATDAPGGLDLVMAILIATIVVVMHRQNIKRLLEKKEPKVNFGKKKTGTPDEQDPDGGKKKKK